MKIRGERECKQCGTRWSYYETGSVTCPECGSLRSVGVDERTEHTAAAVELDLTDARSNVDEEPLRAVAEAAAETCAEYCRKQGFIHAGELVVPSDTYLAAAELRHVGEELARRMRHDDDERLYFLSLLRGAADGERPPPEDVPETVRPARGLAIARVVDDYLSDVRRFFDGEFEPPVRELLSRLTERRKRLEALDGDVDPADAERLVRVTRDLGRYLCDGDEAALSTARSRLDDAR